MRRPPLSVVLGLALVFALLGAAVFATQSSEAGESQRSRVIDRTFVCSVPLQAGIRELHVTGQSGVRDRADRSKWFALAYVHVGFAWVRAGSPEAEERSPVQQEETLLIYRTCRQSALRVPLSPKGLSGGRASQLLESYECAAPRRIRLRVRAEFGSPTSLRSTPTAQWTRVPVKAGYLAVRTEAGKPLAYAEAFESGKARLFFTGNCVRG